MQYNKCYKMRCMKKNGCRKDWYFQYENLQIVSGNQDLKYHKNPFNLCNIIVCLSKKEYS